MYELEPGDRLWPYHTHHANEEWMIVLRGRPTLRTPEGEQELQRGRRRLLPTRQGRAHQVRNGPDEPIRVLMLSTLLAPDIVEYADSDKVSVGRREGRSGCSASSAGPTPSTGKASSR